MKGDLKQMIGVWDLGYSLDKQTTRSIPIGPNAHGFMQFDTIRPEAGQSLFLLKNRSDFTQVPIIARQLNASFGSIFKDANLIVPVPPSKFRVRQPVIEIARQLAQLMKIPCHENFLRKTAKTPQMKNIASRADKVAALMNAFVVNDMLGEGLHNVLIVDDIFDTGASLEAATNVLRACGKINRVYVSTVTRKKYA
jgi:predicted amidophosphoribosyltransferase